MSQSVNVCPNCGRQLLPGETTCLVCGSATGATRVNPQNIPPQPPPRPTQPPPAQPTPPPYQPSTIPPIPTPPPATPPLTPAPSSGVTDKRAQLKASLWITAICVLLFFLFFMPYGYYRQIWSYQYEDYWHINTDMEALSDLTLHTEVSLSLFSLFYILTLVFIILLNWIRAAGKKFSAAATIAFIVYDLAFMVLMFIFGFTMYSAAGYEVFYRFEQPGAAFYISVILLVFLLFIECRMVVIRRGGNKVKKVPAGTTPPFGTSPYVPVPPPASPVPTPPPASPVPPPAPPVPPAPSNSTRVCTGCGCSLGERDLFCGNCGLEAPMTILCTTCGALIPAGQKYCGNCGTAASASRSKQ